MSPVHGKGKLDCVNRQSTAERAGSSETCFSLVTSATVSFCLSNSVLGPVEIAHRCSGWPHTLEGLCSRLGTTSQAWWQVHMIPGMRRKGFTGQRAEGNQGGQLSVEDPVSGNQGSCSEGCPPRVTSMSSFVHTYLHRYPWIAPTYK